MNYRSYSDKTDIDEYERIRIPKPLEKIIPIFETSSGSDIEREINSYTLETSMIEYLNHQLVASTQPIFDIYVSDKLSIESAIKNLFHLAQETTFEEGMVNEFSIRLEKLIEIHGNIAIPYIQSIILKEKVSPNVAMYTLRYIGNLDSNVWHVERRQLLEKCLLQSRFMWVRDGAGLGLSYMDDPDSIPVLKQAIRDEKNTELREDLELVLEQLENTLQES